MTVMGIDVSKGKSTIAAETFPKEKARLLLSTITASSFLALTMWNTISNSYRNLLPDAKR